jgi:hypothetical protein
MGTILSYIQAVFFFLSFWLPGLILAAGLGFGAYGIANEKRWGYRTATAAAIAYVALAVLLLGFDVLNFPFIINFMFAVALVALLVHPESREYQRIWFK